MMIKFIFPQAGRKIPNSLQILRVTSLPVKSVINLRQQWTDAGFIADRGKSCGRKRKLDEKVVNGGYVGRIPRLSISYCLA